MADISVEQKTGADLTWIWAIAAVVAIGGLMFWLFSAQPDPATQAAAPAATDTVAAAPAVNTVELTAINAAPDSYVGQEVQVPNVSVSAVLGTHGFWAEVPNANPFLVVLAPEAGDPAWLAQGAVATITGVVEPVTDVELDAWVASGAVQESSRTEASFVSHYIRGTAVQQ